MRAVDDVSFSIKPGETLGIVGESGSGKSVACSSLLRLIPQPPGKIESGHALFDGVDLLHCPNEQLREIRGNRISMIFQDPMTSLNPYMRIGDQVIEPLIIPQRSFARRSVAAGIEALREVGIPDCRKTDAFLSARTFRRHAPARHDRDGVDRRPAVAHRRRTDHRARCHRAGADSRTHPQFAARARHRGHFHHARHRHCLRFCDRVLVIYAGRIVEAGSTSQIFYEPKHPYSQALQRSIPALHEKGEELYTIPGAPPDLSKPIAGCPFAPRCEYAQEKCVTSEILLKEVAPGHDSACLRVQLGEIELAPLNSVVAKHKRVFFS